MKKLLGILVLGLLLSSNAYADKIPNMNNSVWVVNDGIEKRTLNFMSNGKCTYTSGGDTYDDCSWKQNGNRVELTGNEGYFTWKLKVSGKNITGVFTTIKGFAGQLAGRATHIDKWLTSGSSSKNKTTQAKQICKDLGFKTNTEKFADCALKMYSMNFEASNKVSSGGGTKQEIIVKHKQDYDIFDAMIDMGNALTGSSSSSSSSGTNCRVVQKSWGAEMYCN